MLMRLLVKTISIQYPTNHAKILNQSTYHRFSKLEEKQRH